METIKAKTHIGTDGTLHIQMPDDFQDTSVEVLVVVQRLSSEETKPKLNAWGKPTTKQSIREAIAQLQKLQKEIAFDSNDIRGMIEEGRRF
ncbi:MAG: hypothetical protein ACP5D7_10955 [Limnospira sp.]